MIGYEIKSDCDNLSRLPKQISIYNLIFDELTLVIGERLIIKAFDYVPDWWGIILAKEVVGKTKFYSIRQAAKNPNLNGLAIAQLLWRSEALYILEELQIADGIRSKTKQELCSHLVKQVELPDLQQQVRANLRPRLKQLAG